MRFEVGTDGNVPSTGSVGYSTSAKKFFLSEPEIRNANFPRENASIDVEDIYSTVR